MSDGRPGLTGYSQDPPGPSGQSEDALAKEESAAAQPRHEERVGDVRSSTARDDATDAEFGPNQRSEAFKRGRPAPSDVGLENYGREAEAVPQSPYHPDYTASEGTPKTHNVGREVPTNIGAVSGEPNPGDYYGSTGGYQASELLEGGGK